MVFNEINSFDDVEHEALMGIWWTGVLLKQQSKRFFKERGVTESQFNAMMALKYAEKPLSQQDLSDRLLVDKSNMTALVDSLEKQKLVKRCKERSDRRFYRVKLTSDGMSLLNEIEKPYRELVHRIMSVFSQEEMKAITEKMVRVQRNMESSK